MAQSDLPFWVQYAQALGPPAIAVVGAFLAYQQVTISKVKLQHDLYDRRFAVYDAARRFLGTIMVENSFSDEHFREYVVKTADARFLLNAEISDHLELIRKKALRLRTLARRLADNNLPAGPERTKLADEESTLFTWVMAQIDLLTDKFGPFLTLQKTRQVPMTKYLLDHWRGNQSITQSLLINGVLIYLVLIAAILGFANITKYTGTSSVFVLVAVFVVWVIWLSVGVVRCGWKKMRGAVIGPRVVGVLAIGAVIAFDAAILHDLYRLIPVH